MITDFNLYYPQLFFGLGVTAQIFFSIRGKFERKDLWPLLSAIFFSLLIAILYWFKTKGDLGGAIISAFYCFIIVFVAIFRAKILPKINEIILLVWNVGFWSLYLSMMKPWSYLSLILLIPTCLSLIAGIFKVNLNIITKILLYLWFMIIAVYISIASMPWNEILHSGYTHTISPMQSFLLGVVFFYSFSYLLCIFHFIPLPDENQSFRERMKILKEYINLINSKFDKVQYHPMLMLGFFIILSAIMYLNYSFRLIDQNTLLFFSLSLSIFIGEEFNKKPGIILPFQTPTETL
ncbi:MAG: hypothetical protein NTZ18_04135 [Candidatus Komeilibacteria bacterium]|nr:hypothetical protein [Candidatus Komeilibacteria bacterium]